MSGTNHTSRRSQARNAQALLEQAWENHGAAEARFVRRVEQAISAMRRGGYRPEKMSDVFAFVLVPKPNEVP